MSNNNQSSNDKWATFILNNGWQIKFYCIAGLIFGLLFLVYNYFILESTMFVRYLEFNALLVAKLVGAIYDSGVVVFISDFGISTHIQASGGAFIVVPKEGSEIIVANVLVAGLLAWPSSYVYKLVGAVIALGWIFCLNILRLAGLLATDIYFPLHLDLMMNWVMPLALVIGAFVYFYIWMRLSYREE